MGKVHHCHHGGVHAARSLVWCCCDRGTDTLAVVVQDHVEAQHIPTSTSWPRRALYYMFGRAHSLVTSEHLQAAKVHHKDDPARMTFEEVEALAASMKATTAAESAAAAATVVAGGATVPTSDGHSEQIHGKVERGQGVGSWREAR